MFCISVVRVVNNRINSSENVPMFNYDDLPNNKAVPLEVTIPVCGIIFIGVTLITGKIMISIVILS